MNINKHFPARKKDSHKKDYGHVLIIAGSEGLSGSGVLAAAGASRSGAGLVTLAVPKMIQNVCASFYPDIMTLGIECGSDGMVLAKSASAVLDFARRRRIDFIACGCGMGVSQEVFGFIGRLLKGCSCPVLLDADALNNIAVYDKRCSILKKFSGDLIITPHSGEMARLTGFSSGKIQKKRADTAREFANEHRLVCVLKGNGSIVTDGRMVYVNQSGNPGMAKAGSGDVLCGVIAAVSCRSKNIFEGVCAAVFLHGKAGDYACAQKTSYGMTALDIAENLPASLKSMGVR